MYALATKRENNKTGQETWETTHPCLDAVIFSD
jgi:hypothetical protein